MFFARKLCTLTPSSDVGTEYSDSFILFLRLLAYFSTSPGAYSSTNTCSNSSPITWAYSSTNTCSHSSPNTCAYSSTNTCSYSSPITCSYSSPDTCSYSSTITCSYPGEIVLNFLLWLLPVSSISAPSGIALICLNILLKSFRRFLWVLVASAYNGNRLSRETSITKIRLYVVFELIFVSTFCLVWNLIRTRMGKYCMRPMLSYSIGIHGIGRIGIVSESLLTVVKDTLG